jgi:hypothetical protein
MAVALRAEERISDANYVPESHGEWRALIISRLFAFTATIGTVFPREIRDSNYHHLLDESTMETMKCSMRLAPGLVGYLDMGDIFTCIGGEHPRFMRPHQIHAQLFDEITQAFYEKWRVELDYPQNIRSLLEHDFFGNGIRPQMCTLSSLAVHIYLYEDIECMVPVEPAELAEQFAPLIRPGQLSTRCQLQIIFDPGHCRYENTRSYSPSSHISIMEKEMRLLETSLRILKPMVNTFKTICPRGDVQVFIDLETMGCPDIEVVTVMAGQRRVQDIGSSKFQSVYAIVEDREIEDAEHVNEVERIREAVEKCEAYSSIICKTVHWSQSYWANEPLGAP